MSSPTASPTDALAPSGVDALHEVMALEKDYLLQNYARYPVMLQRGKGCYLYDTNGRRYLDLLSGIGVNALGHAHPRILKVLREQAGLLIHSSNLYYHAYQGPLAKKIAEISGLPRSFFCNSGTEGMEAAVKMIRSHGQRAAQDGQAKIEIIALENSFHGRTVGAISITGQEKYRRDFEPLLSGVRFIEANDTQALADAVNGNTAGIVLETIQGEGGIHPISDRMLRTARELADQHDALLVFDEIQCGVGRPGVHFAYQMHEPIILPDVMVAAKPLACGLPLGVVACNEKAAATIGSGMHGTTFGGGPLACRVALEFLAVLDELLPSITHVGSYFRMRLDELARRYAVVREVRGFGLMLGMELDAPCKSLVMDALAEGLLINVTHDTVMRFLPPYILTEPDVDRAMVGLEKIIANFQPAA